MNPHRYEGRMAYWTGAANPYAFGTPANHEWARGWHDAQEDAGQGAWKRVQARYPLRHEMGRTS